MLGKKRSVFRGRGLDGAVYDERLFHLGSDISKQKKKPGSEATTEKSAGRLAKLAAVGNRSSRH